MLAEIGPVTPEELHGLVLFHAGIPPGSVGAMTQEIPVAMPVTVQLSVDGFPGRTRVALNVMPEGGVAPRMHCEPLYV